MCLMVCLLVRRERVKCVMPCYWLCWCARRLPGGCKALAITDYGLPFCCLWPCAQAFWVSARGIGPVGLMPLTSQSAEAFGVAQQLLSTRRKVGLMAKIANADRALSLALALLSHVKPLVETVEWFQ